MSCPQSSCVQASCSPTIWLFSPKKKEPEEEHKARLKKTALGLPTTLIKKAVVDMHWRVRMVIKAGGDLLNE